MKMMALLVLATAGLIASGGVFAQSLPDGPVASPPGWSCTASGGRVTCVRKTTGAP